MKLFSILPILLIPSSVGCATIRSNAGVNLTSSMCLDALIVNIHKAGCKAVSVESSVDGITKIHCHKHNKYNSNSEFINNEFFGIAFGSDIPQDTVPICMDPYLAITTAERD
tara:strand:- start:184 stop:519 length:336 start_codon:yes stop_codon:yes gene_type:complete